MQLMLRLNCEEPTEAIVRVVETNLRTMKSASAEFLEP